MIQNRKRKIIHRFCRKNKTEKRAVSVNRTVSTNHAETAFLCHFIPSKITAGKYLYLYALTAPLADFFIPSLKRSNLFLESSNDWRDVSVTAGSDNSEDMKSRLFLYSRYEQIASFIYGSSKASLTVPGTNAHCASLSAEIFNEDCSSSSMIRDITSLTVFMSKSKNTVMLTPKASDIFCN